MDALPFSLAPLLPAACMSLVALLLAVVPMTTRSTWRWLGAGTAVALLATAVLLVDLPPRLADLPGLQVSRLGLAIAVLVQTVGLVVGVFSARYLQGEPDQRRYAAALATVLAAVQVLLLADHWGLLIAAWAAVGLALERLLCFYGDRPFALLAAHKKRVADRTADVLLVAAAGLSWHEVGTGSLSDLSAHVQANGLSPALQVAAVLLVLAVVLRTALMPVHGWLIQVMEAPTPVSALLHAGVVNLGGVVLIRFAELLEPAFVARGLLVVFGLGTALGAGLVMLTRISIKVRLAWSTVAQMGFMVLECGLGLTTLAALHLVGHSLYKAHAFLAASDSVRQTRRRALYEPALVHGAILLVAPVLAAAVVAGVAWAAGGAPWPWWWSGLLALAWAPLLWLPGWRPAPLATGLALAAALTGVALAAHALPLGLADAPHDALGVPALAGFAALYAVLATLQWRPAALGVARRWSYTGFYLDEFYTRWSLRLWPRRWTPAAPATTCPHPAL
ncbi:NADH-quinone oxidoreductase subunit L [Pelomonas cellulosilytica]|uniref:Probable inorganic carbon transporter subunit DabB n=1 Tax=Pelomonas cellulosilytica TaxID=2906762 RepID=A0ABS8XXQ8_9BURK|nr:NADH-quinone oxidoreductase subunit L [Pelomonas sp. P8]MCE4555556.1 NADH-quinone oxidoreductase subunit L [Pelomonas sp. P8]